MKAEIRKKYESLIRPEWMKAKNCTNVHQVPLLRKVVLNMGLGKGAQDKKIFEAAKEGMTALSGQVPFVTKAKKSIAAFKVREGMNAGLKVTLRKKNMYYFLERLINVAMPRIRDFRGLSSKSFDGRGGISFGILDYSIFPEIRHDESILGQLGLDISVSTTAKNDQDAKDLLEQLGVPFYE